MSKLSTINPLSLALGALFLISLASFRVSSAADMSTVPQVQAANVLQHPTTWIASTDGFKKAGYVSDKARDSQQQAQRVLQPVHDVANTNSVASGQSLASESLEPQLQAIRLLSQSRY